MNYSTALERCVEKIEEAHKDLRAIRVEKARLVYEEVAVQRKIDALKSDRAELEDGVREDPHG